MAQNNTLKTNLRKIIGRVTLWFALNILLLSALLGIEFSSLSKPVWWNESFSLLSNLLTGGLVSFFFYWLVVYLPEQRKRNIIKNSLAKTYNNIKEGILHQVIFASIKGGRQDLQLDQNTITNLMTIKGFKDAFSDGREANEGFYAFENQMSDDTPEFREIVLKLEMLEKQIEFVLDNYTIEDEKLFDFFKRLQLLLLSLRQTGPGYDESKLLCVFIFEMFSGFNRIEGYRGYDVIDKMITDI